MFKIILQNAIIFKTEIFMIFSCPKGSSIGDEVTGAAAGGGAVLSKSREVPGKCRGSPGK